MPSPRTWIILALVPTCAFAWGDECDFAQPLSAQVPADGATRLVVDAGAGSLVVTGGQGSSVDVDARACADSAEGLESIRLVAERRGDTVYVAMETEPADDWGRGSRSLDLTLSVPAELEAEIDDGSGSIVIRDLRALRLEDGSGDVEIAGIAGDVRIDDGSGDLVIEGVGGNVRIEDGSGSIQVRRVGSVRIEGDGSGDIELAEIEGDAIIDEDGSGSIRASDVGGDFTVADDGSGDIRPERISGRISIPVD